MESDKSIYAHCDFQARWVFLSEFFIFVWFHWATPKKLINSLCCFLVVVVVVVEYIFLAINSTLTHICYICSTLNWNVLVCCLRNHYEQRGWLLSKYKAPLYRKNLQLYKRKILRQNLQIYHSQQYNLGTYENVTETGHSHFQNEAKCSTYPVKMIFICWE